MKAKIIIRLAVFLGFLLAGFVYLETIFSSDHEFLTTRQQLSSTQKRTNIDVLLMGSSHMYANINPYLLDKLNKTISFNIGSATMNFDFTSIVLDKVLEKTQPKLVVIELSQSSFPKMTESDKGFHLRLLDYCDNLSVKKFEMVREHYDPSEYLNVYWQLYRNRKNWTNISYFDLAGDIRGNSSKKFRYKGYVGARDSIGAKFKKKYSDYDVKISKFDSANKTIEQRHLDEFDRLRTLSKKHDFEVLFITAPDLRSWPYNYYLLDKIKEVTASYGFKYLNLCAPPYVNHFTLMDYIDEYHLNIWGGIKATELLSNFISENFNLPDRSNTAYWNEQMTELQNFERDFIIGSETKVLEIKDSLFYGVKINGLNFKKFYEKLFFTASFDSVDSDTINDKYKVVIKVFPKKGYEHHLSKESRSKNRNFDTGFAIIKDINRPATIQITTAIDKIDRIWLFLTNNSSNPARLGRVIVVDGDQLISE